VFGLKLQDAQDKVIVTHWLVGWCNAFDGWMNYNNTTIEVVLEMRIGDACVQWE
jgi:hypothetical protein